ncbi:MAG TPA: hypothetical protein VIM64_03690 [Puia sp.]
MKAFTILMEEGGRHFKCFVQKIDGKSEDIYIVNFTDSILIRKYCAKKTIFYIDRNERAEDKLNSGGEGSGLWHGVWEAILGEGRMRG